MGLLRPILIFDGECAFCRKWINYWASVTADRLDYLSFQDILRALRSSQGGVAIEGADPNKSTQISQELLSICTTISVTDFDRSVILVSQDGSVTRGALAVFTALGPSYSWARLCLGAYKRLGLFRGLSEVGYQLVASHRVFFSRLVYFLWGDIDDPTGKSSFRIGRWLFVKGLSLIYFAAFLSLLTQIEGLVGDQGISPASLPWGLKSTVLGISDFWIRLVPLLGIVFSCVLFLGLLPMASLIVLWGLYEAAVELCGQFLWFQWDSLLLEMGFLAIFLVPFWRLPFRLEAALNPKYLKPSPAVLFLLRWLLFRVIFFSGYVKLASGDPQWWSLSALDVHFATQPLPTWLGWYAHQVPQVFRQASTAIVIFIELVVVWLIFAPRRPRFWAAMIMICFQMLIGLTGNYGFFNWQVVALSLLLVDDSIYLELMERLKSGLVSRDMAQNKENPVSSLYRVKELVFTGVAGVLVAMILGLFGEKKPEIVSRLRLVNSYGVFAVMTARRDEVVLEGSLDGEQWFEYTPKWKPGDLSRSPPWLVGHMPRLDWQFWFAALSDLDHSPWVIQMMARLLQGSPSVEALFEATPFGRVPPTFIRAIRYEYQFTDQGTRARTGEWWVRQKIGSYSPVFTNKIDHSS